MANGLKPSDGKLAGRAHPLTMTGAAGSLAWVLVWFYPKRSTSADERDAITVQIADFVVASLGNPGRPATKNVLTRAENLAKISAS